MTKDEMELVSKITAINLEFGKLQAENEQLKERVAFLERFIESSNKASIFDEGENLPF